MQKRAGSLACQHHVLISPYIPGPTTASRRRAQGMHSLCWGLEVKGESVKLISEW